jgi:predicted GNAT family N-acyltransferase
MIIEAENKITIYYDELDLMLRRHFDDFQEGDTFSRADYRSLQLDSNRIISHAALQKRDFDFVADPSIDCYLLGYVCTDTDFRNQGFSRKCMKELIGILGKERWIVVLNCKDYMVDYYTKFGFEVIGKKAYYLRNGNLELDSDPVMALCNPQEFHRAIIRRDVLNLGEDF